MIKALTNTVIVAVITICWLVLIGVAVVATIKSIKDGMWPYMILGVTIGILGEVIHYLWKRKARAIQS